MAGRLTETIVWAAMCACLLVALLLRIGETMGRAMSWLRRHTSRPHLTPPHVATLLLAGLLAGAVVASPTIARGQGWWGGSPVNPGFERSTVIRVSGTLLRMSLDPRSGPATLVLECPRDTYTVMLGPGWYLARLRPDIREGDPLSVEGSKMMDRRGSLHLVAARVRNERTGAVLELRDDLGRPLWMGGRPSEKTPR
jgi:hypothetical protein